MLQLDGRVFQRFKFYEAPHRHFLGNTSLCTAAQPPAWGLLFMLWEDMRIAAGSVSDCCKAVAGKTVGSTSPRTFIPFPSLRWSLPQSFFVQVVCGVSLLAVCSYFMLDLAIQDL